MQLQFNLSLYPEKELEYQNVLEPFIPKKSLYYICSYLAEKNAVLKISKSRKTKYGDFRAEHKGKANTITINHDLNSFAFLITLVHEMAHLECWINHKNKAKPHGSEWKDCFKQLMQPYFFNKIFPSDIMIALTDYMNNPAASSCSDLKLMRALKAYDNKPHVTYLEDVPENTIFKLGTNRIFQKGEKRRKLFKCKDLANKKYYLVNPLSEVIIINN